MHDSMTEMYLAHGTMFALGLVMQIAFFVVAITAVRRQSTEASNLMVAASAIHFGTTLLSPFATFFASRLYGVEELVRVQMISTVVFGLVGLLASCLLLAGIARLAEDRRPSATSREP